MIQLAFPVAGRSYPKNEQPVHFYLNRVSERSIHLFVPRVRPQNRLPELIAVATKLFARRGFQLVTMRDVSTELGLSVGVLYQAVESKEALFDLVVRHGLGLEPADTPLPPMPVPTPAPGVTIKHLERLIDKVSSWPVLDAALATTEGAGATEFRAIAGETFDRMSEYRVALQVLAKSAHDWPELAAVLLSGLRARFLDAMTRYLRSRVECGAFTLAADPSLCAVVILETLASWSFHRFGDPFYQYLPESDLRTAVIEMLVASVGA